MVFAFLDPPSKISTLIFLGLMFLAARNAFKKFTGNSTVNTAAKRGAVNLIGKWLG